VKRTGQSNKSVNLIAGVLMIAHIVESGLISLRIPMKPAMHSNLKPATHSEMKPARVPK
jgi:hypothetical protein